MRYASAFAALVAFAAIFAVSGEARSDDTVTVSAARLGVHGDTTRFVAEFSQKQDYRVFTLADPYRVVVDLPPVDWQAPGPSSSGRGVIAAYRYGLFKPDAGRLVLDLSAPARIARVEWIPPRDGHAWRLIFDLEPTEKNDFLKTAGWPSTKTVVASRTVASPPVPVPEPKPAGAVNAAPELREPQPVAPVAAALIPVPLPAPGMPPPDARKADRVDEDVKSDKGKDEAISDSLPVIVIDPGHGGIDPGASAEDGTFEKDVVLAVAEKLAGVLGDSGRYTVRLTRSDDSFLKLKERVDFARHAKADLFISLHADALASNPKVGGLSVYTLSETASDKEAEALASKENRADVIAGVDLTSESDDVTMILIDLAQRETMNQSIQLAHSLSDALKGDTRMVKNNIRQAGFRVLKAPDVCSVLIELGYLSNARDLERMESEDWRARFANAVLQAADAHFAAFGEQRSAWRQ